jgi:uncharacterized repeat protein (TIGR01451 family)
MRRTAIIPFMLGVVGLSIVAIVRAQSATEPTVADDGSPSGAVIQASEESPSPANSRRSRPLLGRIGLPWNNAGNGRDDTDSSPADSDEESSAPGRLTPENRADAQPTPASRTGSFPDVSNGNGSVADNATPSGTSRLQRRLQALRDGNPESHTVATPTLASPADQDRQSQPTQATPPPAGEVPSETDGVSLAPGPGVAEERSVLNSGEHAPTSAAPETDTPATAAPAKEAQPLNDDELNALPSILTRRSNRPPDAAFSTRPTEPEVAAPAEEPAPQTPPSSRRRQPPTDETSAAKTGSPGQPSATETVNPKRLFAGQLPAVEIETIGSQTIVVGKEANFVVRAKNLGQMPVDLVMVEVDLPSSAELKGNTATNGAVRYEALNQQTARIQWQINSLDPNRPEELVLKMIPRDATAFDLAATWTVAPVKRQTHIRVLEPKLELHLTGPPEVLYGETKFYTITISNPGTGTAENVAVNLLPINPGEESPGETTLGPIEAGGRKEIEIELTARQAGTIRIQAKVSADGNLQADALQEVLVRRANLGLTAVAPQVKYAGTLATYRITVTNTGDAAATNVMATATLPAGSKFVPSDDGGKYDDEEGTVSWSVGPLRPEESRDVELQCVLDMAGDNQLHVKAEATGDLSASHVAHTRVEALADLKLNLNDPKGPLPVGEDVKYEIRITNRGTKAAENVQLVVYFSEGLEPTSVDGGRSRIETGQIVFDAIDRIDAGQEVSFQINAHADRPGNHICRTELECREPETRLANEETTRFYGDQTSAEKPLEARRSPTPAPLAPQQMESYR